MKKALFALTLWATAIAIGWFGMESLLHLLNKADEFGPMGKFYLSLPIGIVGMLLVFFFCPKDGEVEDGRESGRYYDLGRRHRGVIESNRGPRIYHD